MRADVFQAVALCCHANAYLAGQSEVAPELISNTTLHPVHELLFERAATGKLASGIVADATAPWLKRLAKEGVERLGITLSGCSFDPSAPTTEPWGILSDGDVGVEIWQPYWKKRFRVQGDASPWRVTYTAHRASRWNLQSSYGFADTARLLHSVIQQTSEAHPLIATLPTSGPAPFPDLYPGGWPAKHRELGELGAKVAALMRSDEWAEVLTDRELSPADYEAISQKLWKASLMALEASVKITELASELPTSHIRRAG